MFYNTNELTGQALADARQAAATQEQAVLDYFRAHPYAPLAPCTVWKAVLPRSPLTSVRRAITNLTSRNLLERTDTMVTGTYGKPVHTWKLRQDKPQ